MTIVIPANGVTWERHEVPRGVCFAASVPPGRTSKLFLVLPEGGDNCVEASVGEGANLEIVTLQENASGTIRAAGRVASGGVLRWRPVTIGGSVRHEIRSICTGDGARSEASWIVVARDGEYSQAIIRNTFEARNGGGEVAMRAVALAKGQVLLDGRIEIGNGGGGTQTYLTQEALMLDSSAKIDAIPGLEIKTNDVKASHSATVSRVNPDDVFYAGSRGIAPDDARRLLVEGFLGKLIADIDDETVRNDLLSRIIAASVASADAGSVG